MQLKFPKRRDFWTWEELSCLSSTLGFQRDLFAKNVAKEKSKECTSGMHPKDINEMFELKVLSPDLHRTFNMHDDTYNTKVVQKSIDLLSNRFLTFQQIKESRMAFQFYEHMDNAGLVVSEHVILRTLKMCGRAVSPAKLMQHLKHMDRLVPDRLMFYEFLDLLLICEKISADRMKRLRSLEEGKIGKNDQSLYELKDFRELLLTEDEKSAERLNQAYKFSLEKIPMRKSKESSDINDEKPWLVPPIVPHEVREKMGKINKKHRELLTKTLALSNNEVLAKGTFPSCNCDKPDLIPNKEVRPGSVFDNDPDQIFAGRPTTSSVCEVPAVDSFTDHFKLRGTPVVTEEDISSTRKAIEEVRWNIATQGERMRRKREQTQKRPRLYTERRNTARDNTKKTTEDHASKDFHSKGHPTNNVLRPVRARIKKLSLTMKSDEGHQESKVNPGRNQKPSSAESTSNGENNNISLDERLKQIDQLVNRVCQR
ncbi:uncharacterized protein LOC135695376 [Rhopilema esculentum]|uniref:uncharacterized protein LOC135695376 n=1 Tax=Rhopilema esculentum TaxID=499914 RepID=UPI0031E11275